MTIMNEIRNQAKHYPEKIAIKSIPDQFSLNYTDLVRAVEAFANTLSKIGVKRNTHVITTLHNGIGCVISMLAIADLGAVWVPLMPNIKTNALEKAISSTDSNFIIKTEEKEHNIERLHSITIPDINLLIKKNLPKEYIPSDDTESAYILTMTSGSTGDPKPIIFSQRTKINRAKAAREIYKITESDIILIGTPMYHSLAQRLTFLPLTIGATAIIAGNFKPDTWIKTIEEEKISFTISVSNQIERIVKEPDISKKLATLRSIVSSSAPLSENSKTEILSKIKCSLHECYGTSELGTVTDIILKNNNPFNNSVGKKIPNTEILIFDKNLDSLPENKIGEIAVKSSMVFLGYYKKEEITKKSFHNGYFLTGDIGYLDQNGYLYYTGRIKEIIISSGINIYPKDIEEVIDKHPDIIESAAFGVPHDGFGEIVLCAIIPKSKNISKKEIRKLCQENLLTHQVPFDFIFIDKLPKNTLGKILRKDLTKKYSEHYKKRL